jgi:hypothetical protein
MGGKVFTPRAYGQGSTASCKIPAQEKLGGEHPMIPVRKMAWRTPDGAPVGCGEKLKVLEQNVEEFRALALDMLEDAALMGCDVDQFRQALVEVLEGIDVRYTPQ